MELATSAGTSSIITSSHLGVPARHETQPPKTGGQYGKCTEYVRHAIRISKTITETDRTIKYIHTQNNRCLPFRHNLHIPASNVKKYTENKRIKQSTKMLICNHRPHVRRGTENTERTVMSHVRRSPERTGHSDEIIYRMEYRTYRMFR